jgi:hypothetical protein
VKIWRKIAGHVIFLGDAGVAELVDAADLKSVGRKAVRVRVPPSAFDSSKGETVR